jgi:ferrochelatase
VTSPVGILCMAYGTAAGSEDIERYYTDIRGGRAPTPEHLQELRERYAAIGNQFPLLAITRRQAAGLERELNAAADGGPAFRSFLGMKHSPPFIAEGVAEMREAGVERAVGLVLAPHWSGMSVETYIDRAEQAVAEEGGPAFMFVRQWYDHPLFVEFLASRVSDALERLDPAVRDEAVVVFSAHSLPTRTLEDGSRRCKLCSRCEEGCRYVEQLLHTAELVSGRLGRSNSTIGWQSAGRTADPWWGPPVEDVIRDLAGQGIPAVVSCSAGFVADHLEVLYDLDVEARQVAEEAGIAFVRTDMPNDDSAFVRTLAAIVRDHLEAGAGAMP